MAPGGFRPAFPGVRLEWQLAELRDAYGYAMLLDGHTGSRKKDAHTLLGRGAVTC